MGLGPQSPPFSSFSAARLNSLLQPPEQWLPRHTATPATLLPQVTTEEEIEQRDLYDRPPSVFKPWTQGNVALLGDAIHAMMPNLGQGGCQAIEDATGEGVTTRWRELDLSLAFSGARCSR